MPVVIFKWSLLYVYQAQFHYGIHVYDIKAIELNYTSTVSLHLFICKLAKQD